jgi:hypothetical protein
MDVSDKILDTTPSSLKRLDILIDQYYEKNKLSNPTFSKLEWIRFIRELVAYFTEVLISHANGELNLGNDLWDTDFLFTKPKKIIENHKTRIIDSFAVSPCNLVLNELENADSEVQGSDLYGIYKKLTSNTIKED